VCVAVCSTLDTHPSLSLLSLWLYCLDQTSSRNMSYRQAQALSSRLQELVTKTKQGGRRSSYFTSHNKKKKNLLTSIPSSTASSSSTSSSVHWFNTLQGVGIYDVETLHHLVLPRLRAHLCLYALRRYSQISRHRRYHHLSCG
jgi:hypothetical protein